MRDYTDAGVPFCKLAKNLLGAIRTPVVDKYDLIVTADILESCGEALVHDGNCQLVVVAGNNSGDLFLCRQHMLAVEDYHLR